MFTLPKQTLLQRAWQRDRLTVVVWSSVGALFVLRLVVLLWAFATLPAQGQGHVQGQATVDHGYLAIRSEPFASGRSFINIYTGGGPCMVAQIAQDKDTVTIGWDCVQKAAETWRAGDKSHPWPALAVMMLAIRDGTALNR